MWRNAVDRASLRGPRKAGSSIASTVLVLMLATSCAGSGATEPVDLVADVADSRVAHARGVLHVKLINAGQTPLEVTSLQLVDPRFTEAEPTPKNTTVAPGGLPIVTPIDIGDVVCGDGVTDPPSLAVVVETAEATDELTLPVRSTGDEVLTRLHETACRQRAVATAATISFAPEWEETAPAVARGRIVVERAASDDEIAVEQVAGTVIFHLNILGGTDPDVVTLAAGQDSAAVEVEVSAARCDPHALIESKKTYLFPMWVRVGDAPASFTILEPEGDARDVLEGLLAIGCDVDH